LAREQRAELRADCGEVLAVRREVRVARIFLVEDEGGRVVLPLMREIGERALFLRERVCGELLHEALRLLDLVRLHFEHRDDAGHRGSPWFSRALRQHGRRSGAPALSARYSRPRTI